jgi:trimeric autotransporter adhesin
MPTSARCWLARIGLACLAPALFIGGADAGAAETAARVVLTGEVPSEALPKFDRGPVPDAFPLPELALALNRPPSRQADLEQYLAAQQDPTSPRYHAWLTPQQFGARFGVPDEDLRAVSQWLTSCGFAVGPVSAGRGRIVFSGTASQVEAAFQIRIDYFVIDGERHFSNVSNPSVPERFKSLIASISGLNDFVPAPQSAR